MIKNYFSWDNINEMADINSHISYVSSLIQNYQWDNSTQTELRRQLNRLINKQNDKQLNICVIGEFSTGKSSFINALVGYELLAVDSIQGTTVAITVIEYGEEFSITITDFHDKCKIKKYADIQVISKDLLKFTTNPQSSDKISFLTITLPSEILKNGFRIIDTPGTNSLDLWHEDITKRAIQDLSDLSLVLIDATKPMPESLSNFIDNTLGYNIKDCAFIANKIDLIRENERSGIIEYIKLKVNNDFEIENPFVLPFSSVALTNMFSNEQYKVDHDSFLLTTDSFKKLLSYTAKNKLKAQARKTLCLIDNIYNHLCNDMLLLRGKYEHEKEELNRSKQTDLKPFIQRQIIERQKIFILEAKQRKSVIEGKCDRVVKSAVAEINKKIDARANLDDLSNYIKSGSLSDDIKKQGITLSSSIECCFNEIEILFEKEVKNYQLAFKNEFSRLKMLPLNLQVTPHKFNIRHISHSANIGQVTTLVSDELAKENWAFGGAAAAGAIAGSAVVPVIGTFIGGFLGFIAGAALAPDIDDVKPKVKSKLSIPLRSYYQSVSADCIVNVNTYISDLNKGLETEISRYYATYNETIQQRLYEWEKQYRAVSTKINSIQNETDRIRIRQGSIHNIINSI